MLHIRHVSRSTDLFVVHAILLVLVQTDSCIALNEAQVDLVAQQLTNVVDTILDHRTIDRDIWVEVYTCAITILHMTNHS